MTMPTKCLIAVMVLRLMSKHQNRMSEDECGTTVAAVGHVCYDTNIGELGNRTIFCFLVFPGALDI